MRKIFIFVPGQWNPIGSFDTIAKNLESLDYLCFVVEDDHQNYRQGFDYYLQRLVCFVRKVKSRNENSKIILVGQCIGLPLCLKAAEITGIVNGILNLSGAPFKLSSSWMNVWLFRYLFGRIIKRPFQYLLPLVFGKKMSICDSDVHLLTSNPEIAKDWGKKREPSSGKAARDLMRGIPVNLAKIPPVFHFICDQDKIINFELQERVAKKLGGTRVYSWCGHWAQLEKPHKITDVLLRFFSK